MASEQKPDETTAPNVEEAASPSDEVTATAKAEPKRPAGQGGRGPRGGKKIAPVRAGSGRGRSRTITAAKAGRVATGTIVMFVVVGIVALSIIGYAIYKTYDANRPFGQQRAQQIDGVVNYREQNPKMLSRKHVKGTVNYPVSPPVGGNHNPLWQTCQGDVYAAQIANEHATHSLEHGAVWVTYRPDLPQDQIAKLAKKVRGQDYMLMSPYSGLKSPISLQAWGFSLKVDSANDPRIDEFIVAFRKEASVEPGSTCSSNVSDTGDKPVDVPTGGAPGAPQLPAGAGLPSGAGLPGGVPQ